jgi:hypothetical protein
MKVKNLTAWTDKEFLADSIRCWQEALERGDYEAFRYWAVHCFCFARNVSLESNV